MTGPTAPAAVAAAVDVPVARYPFAARIRAVLFDAGNTLVWIDHARIASLLSAHGVAADEASVRRAERAARPRLDPWLASAERREGREVARRYAELVLDGLGAGAGVGAGTDGGGAAAAAGVTSEGGGAETGGVESVRAVVDAVLGAWPVLWSAPPPDARPTLERLLAAGYRVGVVSNSNGTVRKLLDDAGLASLLGCVVDSAIEGVEKPDPRLFLRGAERLGAPPSGCVYVGDFRSLDVDGARAAGMEGVLLDPDGVWGPAASEGGVGSAVGGREHRATSLADFAARLLG